MAEENLLTLGVVLKEFERDDCTVTADVKWKAIGSQGMAVALLTLTTIMNLRKMKTIKKGDVEQARAAMKASLVPFLGSFVFMGSSLYYLNQGYKQIPPEKVAMHVKKMELD